MLRMTLTASAAAMIAAGAGLPAAAQQDTSGQQMQNQEAMQGSGEQAYGMTRNGMRMERNQRTWTDGMPRALSDWSYDDLYADGMIRGEELIDADVYGETGEEVGEVEDVFIKDDKIAAITVESGGFLDIGDTTFVVPWEKVSFVDDGIQVPVNDENIDEFDLWGEGSVVRQSVDSIQRVEDDGVMMGVESYRLTDVIDDYALAEGAGYGYIDDVMLNKDGSIEAVVIMARNGMRAAPYYGPRQGYDPFANTYELGYSVKEVDGLEPFDYDEMDGDWF